MDEQKTTDFLLDIAHNVDSWVAESAIMERFRERFRRFCEIDENNRYFLLDLPYDLQVEETAEWAYGNLDNYTEEEKKLSHYAMLVIIHDKRLKGIGTIKINDDIWPETGCIVCRPEDVWNNIKEKIYKQDAQVAVMNAFNSVKSDLEQFKVKNYRIELQSGKAGTQAALETEQKAPSAKIVNIERFQGVFGNVQAENVQTGDYSSIQKHPIAEEKKKGFIRKLLEIIGDIISFIRKIFWP